VLGACVEQEGPAGSHHRDRGSTDRRTEHAKADRSDQLVESVGSDELVRWDELGDDGVERRAEDPRGGAVGTDDRIQEQERRLVRPGEKREGDEAAHAYDVAGQHDATAVGTVRQQPADGEEQQLRGRKCNPRQGHPADAVGHVEDLPGERHQEDAVAHQAH
jgi:hypothetical protein